MTTIFISYRVEDCLKVAEDLYKRLDMFTFIFWDKVELLEGDDWDKELDENLRKTDVILALVGPRWASILKEKQNNATRERISKCIAEDSKLQEAIVHLPAFTDFQDFRDEERIQSVLKDERIRVETVKVLLEIRGEILDDLLTRQLTYRDYVVREVNTGLARGIRVIPVLVGDFASQNMPQPVIPQNLPDTIHEFGRLQYFRLQAVGDDEGKYDEQAHIEQVVIDSLTQAIKRQPIYDAMRHSLESISVSMLTLADDSGNYRKTITDLVDSLRTAKINPPNDGRAVVADGLDDRKTINLYGDSTDFRNALLHIIEKVGPKVFSSTAPDDMSQYIQNQLLGVFKLACRELALADRHSPRGDKGNDPVAYHGFWGLLKMINVQPLETDTLVETGRRALAFYREYNSPPANQTLDAEATTKYIKDEFKFSVDPKKKGTGWDVNFRMFRHTWREFVSEEVIGGLLMAFVLAVAFAAHKTLLRLFLDQKETIVSSNTTGWACWWPANGSIPWCSIGTLLDVALLISVTVFGIYYVRREKNIRIRTWITFFVGALAVSGVAFVLVFNVNTADISTLVVFWLRFVLDFFVAGLITMPVTVLFLGSVGLMSVLRNERRVRPSPLVHNLAIITTAVSIGFVFFLFAAVNEKTRGDVLRMLLLGLIWGLCVGVAIWQGFLHTNQTESRLKTMVQGGLLSKVRRFLRQPQTQRVFLLMIVSAVVATIVGVIGWWPNEIEFFSLPIVYSGDLASASTYVDSIQQATGVADLVLVIMLGMWLAVAVFFGVETLSHKMQRPADMLPEEPTGERE